MHKLARNSVLPVLGLTLFLGGSACNDSEARIPGDAQVGNRAMLQSVHYGRLVDVYAWRRVDPKNGDRLHALSRVPILVEREVMINPGVASEDPFSSGAARYRFLPYDPAVGHRELLILWDDTHPDEAEKFQDALESAKSGLVTVGIFHAFKGGGKAPAPVVPADAAVRLTFDRPLGLGTAYFDKNQNAVQLLRLVGDPDVLAPSVAYSPISSRTISKENGKYLVIDPEISGKEAQGRQPNPAGMPASLDSIAANIRIALPTSGPINKTLRVAPDQVAAMNSVDVRSEQAVIRDFRAGNRNDPNFGNLPDGDAPEIVTRKQMGILAVDVAGRELFLNKRFAEVVLRPRIPFVDGPISAVDGRPKGPRHVPQGRPLQNGDLVIQEVVSPFTGETVRIRAEIIENRDIPTKEEDPDLGMGGGKPTVRVVVSTVKALDSAGNEVVMQGDSLLPMGKECEVVVHYHDQIMVQAGATNVGDSGRIQEFVSFTPEPPRLDPKRIPLPPNENVDPMARVTVEFSKPMALNSVHSEDNVVLANRLADEIRFLDHVKIGNMAVVPSLPADLREDATAIRLSPPLGFFHEKTKLETYYLHVRDGPAGPRDRGGNQLELFDVPKTIDAVTFLFKLDPKAENNFVSSIVHRFNSADENGTTDQDVISDFFGQQQVLPEEGRMYGSKTFRFSRLADSSTLPNVSRGDEGECEKGNSTVLYRGPVMFIRPPIPPAGGISEPHLAEGSRVQQTYREDDWQLSNRSPAHFEIDVEQLYWAPFIGRVPSLLTYDVFDRYTIRLGTAEKRPDIRAVKGGSPTAPPCDPDSARAFYARSGLTLNFEGNYLDNAPRVEVVSDKVYIINPANQFAGASGVVFISYPEFEKSYTWRDRRSVGWDAANKTAIGLGGSQNPNHQSTPDQTKDVTSPWLPELDENGDPIPNSTTKKNFDSGYSNIQDDDFKGTNVQDHHPVALPLLVDFFVWPDDSANGFAKGDNLFQLGAILPPPPAAPHGFYQQGWPWMRVQSSGGIDSNGLRILVDPGNARTATRSWLWNNYFGRFLAPEGDDMVYWSQADFVRKVSVATSGYYDTLLPSRNEITPPAGWAGATFGTKGFPDLTLLSGGALRPAAFALLVSPEFSGLPEGTKLDIEFRGCESFEKSDTVYKPLAKGEKANNRGNLLSPDYSCEQFRYAGSGRVKASGLTNYVKKLDQLLDPKTGVAPRFINFRFTFMNNTSVTPALVPFIDFFAIQYRLAAPKN